MDPGSRPGRQRSDFSARPLSQNTFATRLARKRNLACAPCDKTTRRGWARNRSAVGHVEWHSPGAALTRSLKNLLRGEAAFILSLIHISEPTRLGMISYAVFCLKKKKK